MATKTNRLGETPNDELRNGSHDYSIWEVFRH